MGYAITLRMANPKFEEIDAPAHWASALINDDRSGLEERDEKALDAWLSREGEAYSMFYCVGCADESHFACFAGRQTEMLTYTFQVSA